MTRIVNSFGVLKSVLRYLLVGGLFFPSVHAFLDFSLVPPPYTFETDDFKANDFKADLCQRKALMATRIHLQKVGKNGPLPNLDLLKPLVESVISRGDHVGIALQSDHVLGKALKHQVLEELGDELISSGKVHVISVSPWGNFIPALNALLSLAKSLELPLIQYQSFEVAVTDSAVKMLKSELDADTMVAGSVFNGHDHLDGNSAVPLNGVTTIWNTLALWDVQKLSRTGFLAISEGLAEGGIEEVAAISLLQSVIGIDNAKVKLIKFPETHIIWNSDWTSPERIKWQEEKMRSKNSRAETQLSTLGVAPGVAAHISRLEYDLLSLPC